MNIDVWSDMVCPWCYLGSRRLSTAIDRFRELHPDTDVSVRWRAFELDPGAPPEPQDLRTALEKKYGPGSFDSMTGRLVALGARRLRRFEPAPPMEQGFLVMADPEGNEFCLD